MKVIKFGSVTGNKIFPEKIREARVARGLSQSQLSELVGVSSQAISQYEKGYSIPNPSVVLRMVDVLDFPISFFSNSSINKSKKGDIVYFRANKNLTKKLQDACKVRIEWINNAYSMLNKYFMLPKVNMPNFASIDIESLDLIGIEEIANELREYWKLGEGPIVNLIDVLQENGIVITKLKINNKKIDGFSTWKKGIPYIFIENEKGSAVRSRFNLAHELGHLILHSGLNEEEIEEYKTIIEDQANQFAGAFLLPRESFNSEIISSSIDSFVLLKRKWVVSIGAMIKRAQDTEMLTENQIRYLKSQMIKYGYYKKEPMDDSINPEKPYLFKQAFELLIDNNIMDKETLLEVLGINKTEAISLYSLKDDFFDRTTNILTLVK